MTDFHIEGISEKDSIDLAREVIEKRDYSIEVEKREIERPINGPAEVIIFKHEDFDGIERGVQIPTHINETSERATYNHQCEMLLSEIEEKKYNLP